MRRSKAFTLIELLVAMSIIALLIALLLPALRKARAAARQSLCESHHRQLLLGIQMYASDYDYWTPYPNKKIGNTYYPWFVHRFVGQYIDNRHTLNGSTNPVIYCTEMNVSKMMAKPSWDAGKNRTGIGLEFYWDCRLFSDKPKYDTPIRFDAIRSPSKMIMLADSAYAGYKQGYFIWAEPTREVDGIPVDKNGNSMLGKYGTTAYRHSGTCTVGFADGHVESTRDILTAIAKRHMTPVGTNR